MVCPYLETKLVARCLAYPSGLRILRDNELRTFCSAELYSECKIYRQRITENGEQPEFLNPQRRS
jgi:hypothetical protein